jgi:predicted transcriptional regulator
MKTLDKYDDHELLVELGKRGFYTEFMPSIYDVDNVMSFIEDKSVKADEISDETKRELVEKALRETTNDFQEKLEKEIEDHLYDLWVTS